MNKRWCGAWVSWEIPGDLYGRRGYVRCEMPPAHSAPHIQFGTTGSPGNAWGWNR